MRALETGFTVWRSAQNAHHAANQLASLAWANMEEHHPRQAELFRQRWRWARRPDCVASWCAKLPDNLGDEATAPNGPSWRWCAT